MDNSVSRKSMQRYFMDKFAKFRCILVIIWQAIPAAAPEIFMGEEAVAPGSGHVSHVVSRGKTAPDRRGFSLRTALEAEYCTKNYDLGAIPQGVCGPVGFTGGWVKPPVCGPYFLWHLVVFDTSQV